MTSPTCHLCSALLTWDLAVFFVLAHPVVLSGPDQPIVAIPGPHICVCTDCARPLLRRDVQGVLARWTPAQPLASQAVLSEAAALTLRLFDALGPPLDFEQWWTLRHGADA